MNNLFGLTGKTALITGASSGIGKTIALLFKKHGASVILIGRNEEKLKEIKNELGSECFYYLCDVSNIENISMTFTEIKKKFPRIDILVNNAGIYKENSSTYQINENGIITFHKDTIKQLFGVNLLSYWIWGLYVSELMKKQKSGKIINISSVNGISGKMVCDIYDMTKAAINNLTLNQAMQLSEYNICVNAICPSSTLTPMRDKAMKEYPPKHGRVEFDKLESSLVPLQRLCKPEEIAYQALLLAADEGNYTTGQVISIDGGFLLTKKFPDLYTA